MFSVEERVCVLVLLFLCVVVKSVDLELCFARASHRGEYFSDLCFFGRHRKKRSKTDARVPRLTTTRG